MRFYPKITEINEESVASICECLSVNWPRRVALDSRGTHVFKITDSTRCKELLRCFKVHIISEIIDSAGLTFFKESFEYVWCFYFVVSFIYCKIYSTVPYLIKCGF